MTEILEYTERESNNRMLLPKMFQDSSDKTYITITINCI